MQPSAIGLRRITVLEGLSDATLEALARDCAWRNCAAGQHIITRDSQDRSVYFVVSGRVRVTIYSASGRQVTFSDLEAGELVGEVAAIDGMPRSADAVALESTLIASLSPEAFARLLRDEPTVANRVLTRLAGLLRRTTERVMDLSTLGVQNRIHAELLRLARLGSPRDNRAVLDPAPRHVDIAARVSTNREQVTRELSALARSGLLGKQGRALVVNDVRALEALVNEVRASA
jgi:CRP-like cAMP-binding protein